MERRSGDRCRAFPTKSAFRVKYRADTQVHHRRQANNQVTPRPHQLARGYPKVIDETVFGLTREGWVMWAGLMDLWTVIQGLLALPRGEAD
jgi:hypothetical protein